MHSASGERAFDGRGGGRPAEADKAEKIRQWAGNFLRAKTGGDGGEKVFGFRSEKILSEILFFVLSVLLYAEPTVERAADRCSFLRKGKLL